MVPSIVTATHDHIFPIASNVREADRQEIWDSHMIQPMEALDKSLEASTLAWTGLADDQPVCMFGVVPASTLSEKGIVWMIGTELVNIYAFQFLRRNRDMVKVMLSHYPILENYVSAENIRAIQWLKWLKFKIGQIEYIGPFSKPFHKFRMAA